jgi:hypothetical protein
MVIIYLAKEFIVAVYYTGVSIEKTFGLPTKKCIKQKRENSLLVLLYMECI